MPRRFLRYALDIVLLGAAVIAFLTGLLVDRLICTSSLPTGGPGMCWRGSSRST